ncbi:MAG TPA: hypothetical protein VE129_03285 [Thermoanaerobaculia bacterium]|nr:hypothetical protein [Thermoanaerobaculia bacterium]
MAQFVVPQLESDRVYRTRDFAAWQKNPPRFVKRLERLGLLRRLSHGLYVHPRMSRFGLVPPGDDALMRRFLDDTPFVFTGSEAWNALGLGTTAVLSAPRVYNTKRSGRFVLGGRPFDLYRIAFPEHPPREWFVVDLFSHSDMVGASQDDLGTALELQVRRGVFDSERLRAMAARYATKAIQSGIEHALRAA